MENVKFEEISITGRIAYGIMCAEKYLLTKYPNRNWSIVFDYFWKITKLELWDDWMDEVVEIIPEFLFEFDDYESSDFEFLSLEKYNDLRKLYTNTANDVNEILKMVYDLANSHAYSSISGNGIESLLNLKKITNYLLNNGVEIPDNSGLEKYKFCERNGWGNPFDGTYLSKTIS